MKQSTLEIVNQLYNRYPILEVCRESIFNAIDILINSYANNGKLLVCGNGGSAADAQHIVGELMKGFVLQRPLTQDDLNQLAELYPDNSAYYAANLQGALPAVSLLGETALTSAYANDKAPDLVFAQQVMGLGMPGDILLGISTSGNSQNVLYAAEVAKWKGLKVLGLTGYSGGKMRELCDVLVCVPEKETYKIQELHLPVYHCICMALENEFFGEGR